VLEAVARQARDVVDAMTADAGSPMSFLAVDGGMTANNLLMQMLADAIDVPVIRPMMAESVALGAAYAAGLSVGYWADRNALRSHWHRAAEWRSEVTAEARARDDATWRDAVDLSVQWGRRRLVPPDPG
jgi:glycerol kinase